MVDVDNDEPIASLGVPTIRGQRRLLEGASLACAAYYWFDLKLINPGSFGNFPVHIGSTRYVLLVLWIGLVWSAWRYAQQLYRLRRDISDVWGTEKAQELDRLGRRITQRYLSNLPASELQAIAAEYTAGKLNASGVVSAVQKGARITAHNSGQPQFSSANPAAPFARQEVRSITWPSGPFERHSYSVIMVPVLWANSEQQFQEQFYFGISRAQSLRLHIRATIATMIRLPSFLDHVAPVALFLLAVVSLALATVGRHVAPSADYCYSLNTKPSLFRVHEKGKQAP